MEEMEKLVKASVVSEKLSVSISTVYRWAENGVLPAVKFKGALRFRESAVAKFIADSERAGMGAAA